MRILNIFILLFTIVLLGCTGAKKSTESEETLSEPPPTEEELETAAKAEEVRKSAREGAIKNKRLPIDNGLTECYVEATILSIKAIIPDPKASNLCSKAPCRALIRVNKIVELGKECSSIFSSGVELRAFFKFTLGKTNELFPDMNPHFPGLEKSDTFVARFVATNDQSSDGDQVIIYGYRKVE